MLAILFSCHMFFLYLCAISFLSDSAHSSESNKMFILFYVVGMVMMQEKADAEKCFLSHRPEGSAVSEEKKRLSWEEYLFKQTPIKNTLLSTVATDGGGGWMTYNQKYIFFHKVDRILLDFMNIITAKKKELLVVYPVNKFNFLVPLAIEAGYCRRHKEFETIIIVSSDTHIRGEYMSVEIGPTFLHRHPWFTAGFLGMRGSLRDLSKVRIRGRHIEPSIIFCPRIEFLPGFEASEKKLSDYTVNTQRIKNNAESNPPPPMSAVIVHITEGMTPDNLSDFRRWLHKWGIHAALYISTNPYNPQVSRLKEEGVPVWQWNPDAIRYEYEKEVEKYKEDIDRYKNSFCASLENVVNLMDGIKKVVVSIEDQTLNSYLKNLGERYKVMLKASEKKASEKLKDAAKDFLGTVYAFEELLTPLDYCEEEFDSSWGSITISKRIERLEQTCHRISMEFPMSGSFYKTSIQQLKQLYEYMQNKSVGKTSSIVEAIDRAIKEKKSLNIISKSGPTKRALVRYLLEKHQLDENTLKEKKIFITQIKEMNRMPQTDTSLVYGCPKYYQRNFFRNASAKNMGFLVYPTEEKRLLYMLKEEEKAERRGSFENQVATVEKVLDTSKKQIYQIMEKPREKTARRDQIIFATRPASDIQKIDLTEVFSDYLKYDEEIEESERDYSRIVAEEKFSLSKHPYLYEDEIKVLDVKLSGNRHIFIPENAKKIPVFVDYRNEVSYKSAQFLKENDVLITVDKSLEKTLADAVIATVDRCPEMIEITAYRGLWVDALRKGMQEQGDDIYGVAEKLNSKGADITWAAVYFWVRGDIIGPADKNNIKRIGEIYDKPILIEKLEKIFAAVQRLRHIHGSLKRKLKHLTPYAGIASQQKLSDEEAIVDEKLNLYLEDFANIISTERIRGIGGKVTVPLSKANKIIVEKEE